MYDVDSREANIASLETATPLTALGAATPGVFVVPTHAKRITEIIIALAPVPTVDNIMGATTSIHITGSGVVLGEGWFIGPGFTTGGAGTTTPGGGFEHPQRYQTNIPVKGGGQFNIDGFMLGEDVGAIHLIVTVVYDGIPGKIIDADYRSIDLTTTNTPVQLAERGAAIVEGDMRPSYSRIGEIHVNVAAKITAGNAGVGTMFKLSGAGLRVTGNYNFVGPTIAINDDTAISLNCKNINPFRYICGPNGLQVNVNNAIRAEAMMIEGDVGTAFAQIMFAYYA